MMTKKNLLYPFLVLWVLLLTGCAEKTDENLTNPAPSIVDTADEPVAKGVPNAPADERQSTPAPDHRILFLGDSITAGYGIETAQAFPALIQSRIDTQDLPFTVVDGGLSGDTSSGGRSRIAWLLQEPTHILVIELGGNDALRGVDLDVTRSNLTEIINIARETYPNIRVVLAGMQVPPNLGHEYTATFRELFPDLAATLNTELIPFVLEGVGGVSEFMQSDGIHPNAAGHVIVADNVWAVLEPILRDVMNKS